MNETGIFHNSFFAMGTRCDVVFTDLETGFAERIFQIIRNEIIQMENRFSRFIPDSALSELNKAGKEKWISVENELWDVLTICYDFWQMSNGAFDITAAPLIALWKKNTGENIAEAKIEQAKLISGFDNVEFDFDNHKIRFKTDGVEFDLGGIGKGIALDSIKPILQIQGVKNAIVSFGESSILALGNHPNGKSWPLGIRNPNNMNEYLHVFNTSNETVTTSATIFSTDDGEVKKRKHIISPVTGFPVDSDKLISVKSESATMGEFISTTWLILPENDKIILSEKLKKVEILEVNFVDDSDFETKLTIV
jgi:thiamine biosynthesis lipoprotein